jgi:hypothetical protein
MRTSSCSYCRWLGRLTFFIIFYQQVPAIGQRYTDGYVVTIANDTLKGFLKLKELPSRSTVVEFKKDAAAETSETFSSAELTSFHINSTNEHFILQTLDVDMKPIETASLDTDDANPKFEKRTVFLKVLTKGRATLYYYVDEKRKEHFFLDHADGNTFELLYVKYYLSATGAIVATEPFKLQIRKLFSDCPKLNLSNFSYNQTSLLKIVRGYNKCFGATTDEYQLKKHPSRFYLTAGGSFVGAKTSYVFASASGGGTSRKDVSLNPSISPVLGIGLEGYTPKGTISYAGEIIWEKFSHHVDNVIVADFAFSKITLNLIGGRHFAGKNKPFIHVGPSVSFNSVNKNSHNLTRGGDFVEKSSRSLGAIVGGGLSFNRLAFELRFVYARYGDPPNSELETSGLSALVSYKVNNK